MTTLTYDFRTVNENVVSRALTSIEARIARHNAIVGRQLGTPVGRSASAGSSVAAARARGASADAAAKAEAKAAAQAEKYWRSAHQKSVDFRIRQEERAHRARLRQIAREESEQRRAAASLDRQRHSALVAQGRAAERHAMMASRAREKLAGSVLGTAGRSATGTLGTVGRGAATALSIGGTLAVGSALQTEIHERGRATSLALQAGKPEARGELLREAQNVKGFTGAEAIEGLEAFVTKTGDLATARALLGDLSTLALATDSNLGELAATAGQAFNVLKGQIADPVELLREVKSLMPALAAQGAMGAVEIKDLATEFGKLGAATRSFEGGAPRLLRSMGAFAQIALEKGGAASSADASTAAARLSTDIVTNRKKFSKLGVDVVSATDKTKLRAPEEIILDILEKTGGDITKTSGLFGMESRKIFQGVAATFGEAEARQKGTGRAAASAEFERFAGASRSQAQIQGAAAIRLAEPDKQFLEASKEFNRAIGAELLPTVTKLIPKFSEMIPHLAKGADMLARFVGELVDSPITGIGKIIAAKVALDLAGAGLGAVAKGALERALGGALGKAGASAGSVVLGGAAPAGKGRLGGAGPALAATAALVGVGLAVDQATDLADKSGGWKGVWEGTKSLFSGDGFFAGVDAHMNQQARAKAEDPFYGDRARLPALSAQASGAASFTAGQAGPLQLPPGMVAQNAKGERVDFASLPRAQQEKLLASANALDGAAVKLAAAADTLGRASVNRGNTPSGDPTRS